MIDSVHVVRNRAALALTAALLLVGSANADVALAQRAKVGAAKSTPAKIATAKPADAAPKVKGIIEPVNFKEDLRLWSVFFITPELGYVSGEAGTIIRTSDGGESWTVQLGGDPQSKERSIRGLYFLDETHGWAAEEVGAYLYQMLRTTDGETWERIGTPRGDWTDFAFTSPKEGYARTPGGVSSSSAFWWTHDAGKTWTEVTLPPVKVEVDGLMRDVRYWVLDYQFVSPSVGYVVGGNREVRQRIFVFKTEDGGDTWTLRVGEGPDFEGGLEMGGAELFFTDELTGYVKVVNGLFATTDGGETWRGVAGPSRGDLKFADPEVGWTLEQRTFGWTSDGGKRWSSRPISFPAEMRAFSLPRRDRAYVVGDHGMIYRYRIVPINHEAPLTIAAPLMPGFDTSLDEEAETLAAEVAGLEEALGSEAGGGAAGEGASADAQDSDDEGEEVADAGSDAEDDGSTEANSDGGDAEPAATAGGSGAAAWSSKRYGSRLEKIQATLAAVSADIPKFQGKLRNLNLIFFGLQMLNDLTDHGSSAQAALAAFRSSQDAESARAALADLSQAARALVSTARTAFRGKAMAP